jgi:DNA-binding beta-propeller fold protein YncE
LVRVPAAEPDRNASGNDDPTTLVYPPWKHNYGFNRFRQFHLTAYGGYDTQIDSPQGVAAVKLRAKDVDGTSDDDELTVFGVNSGRGEIIYNRSLFTLGFFAPDGEGKKFSDPVGIAADADGNVAVADRGNDRVVLLRVDADTRLRHRAAISVDESGTALKRPSGVAIEDGFLYITDTGNDRVVVVDTAGAFRAEIVDTTGVLRVPFGIAVISESDWNNYGSQFLVVTSCDHGRLSKISLTGDLLESVVFSEISDKDGGFFFVAIDYFSNIYVTDSMTGCIYKFDRNLDYLTRFECGTGGNLGEPRGITVYRRFGQVFVAEKTGASYYWVGTDVLNLSCRGRVTETTIALTVRFVLTEHSRVSVRLEKQSGELVELLANKALMEPGNLRRTYQVPVEAIPGGVADCELLITIEATPVYSSRKHHVVRREARVR